MSSNLDPATVEGFGEEWQTFDHAGGNTDELEAVLASYFRDFPWDELGPDAVGVDVGCGSGRWARLVAPRVGRLHCVDASAQALEVARRNLADCPNAVLHHASVAEMPFPKASLDFAYSLGVLHHVPDTAAALRACAEVLRPGAPFLVYLYYRFDNRPAWFRAVWAASDVVRRGVSRLPFRLRLAVSQAIAFGVYWPLSRTARLLERAGLDVENLPLAAYRHRSVYVLRTDALDRFGTRLEQRFTRAEIRQMMEAAGFERIVFSDAVPYWCAVGRRASEPRA